MPLDAIIEFPRADVDALFREIDRAQKRLGKKLLPAIQWAGVYVGKSLKAATKQSGKLRPIIENPDKTYKTDHRKAPFGVKRWNRNGETFFKPIYRTGEYGKIRFFDKKSMSWFKRDKGGGKWEKIPSGPDIANPEIWAPGIKTDKRRIIGRRGLAKKVWGWAMRRMFRGGTTSLMDIQDVADISIFRDEVNPGIQIENHLAYATPDEAASAAAGNAARKLHHEIERRAMEAFA